ncbi:PspA/IM30 family protein [Corynebacterium hansenii]|uniref:PspA/IM30 family protein n=1 Tax=Corynebacterium hansenii TaxID=394964 RepID=A0ABV7ZP55_9CORY|nr:PspA/IM30 family protein [Corynebacterium hansenii]WJZ01280.1 PspA/IM30 family protein [Corynebacterium hansenii]
MANPFSKGWKYMMSSFDKKIEDNADPKVQIHQAAEAAREQHRQIQEQAASVIGNRNQLEMTLSRLRKESEKLTANARTAVQQADAARAAGDEAKAREFENSAEIFASQLVSVETEIEQTTEMHAQAVTAAEEAQHQAKQSQARYEQIKSQIRELESQADQAKMQEATSRTLEGMQGVANDPNVPTLEGVREKIESRYANALGAQELAQNSHAGRMAEIEASGADARADARLAEIRAQMAKEAGDKELGKGTAGELEAGAETGAEAKPGADAGSEAGATETAADSKAAPGADAGVTDVDDADVTVEDPGAGDGKHRA